VLKIKNKVFRILHDEVDDIKLHPQDWALLEDFLRHPGEIRTETELRKAVWDKPDYASGSLATLIANLRKVLNDPGGRRLLKNVRGAGATACYQFMNRGDVTYDHGDSDSLLSNSPLFLTTLDHLPKLQDLQPHQTLQLLDVRYRATPLIGREDAEESLWKWLTENEGGVSFQALVAHAGRGKTRIAIRLLELVAEHSPSPWQAGFMTRLNPLISTDFERWNGPCDTLIIIDDAARWSGLLERIIETVRDRPPSAKPRLRFLLIERGTKEGLEQSAKEGRGWYGRLVAAARKPNRNYLFPVSPLELPPLDAGEQRRQFLQSALSMLHNFTGQPKLPLNLEPTTEGYLKAAEMGDPLVLLMAAIVAHEINDLAPLSWRRVRLAEYFMEREQERIRHLAMQSHPQIANPEFLPWHMAAYVTLARGLTPMELKEACLEEKNYIQPDSPWSFLDLARLLAETFPADDASAAAAPVIPDIVGEVLITRILADPYQDGTETVSRVFRRKPAAVIYSLVHMVQDFAPRSESQTETDHQRQTLEWLQCLSETLDATSFDENELDQILTALPLRTVVMAQAGRKFLLRIADRKALSSWFRARLMLILGHYENLLGNEEQASECLGQAVEIYGDLVSLDAITFEPLFADALSGFAACLKDVGKFIEAHDASSEALRRSRKLSTEDRRLHLPRLAFTLYNYGVMLAAIGRMEEASVIHEEEIGCYKEILQHPSAYDVHLDKILAEQVRALIALSSEQADLGRRREAITSLSEAQKLSADLAERNPDAFRPLLAKALSHLGARQLEYHDSDHAHATLTRALEVWDDLVKMNPHGFRDERASCLLNTAAAIYNSGNQEGALQLAEEGLSDFRDLAAKSRPALLNAFILSCCRVADLYHLNGKGKMALKLLDECLDDAHHLVKQNRLAYLPSLVHVLHIRTLVFRSGIDPPDITSAIHSISCAAPIYDELVFHNPGRFLPEAAEGYLIWGSLLLSVGAADAKSEALAKIAEALRLIKPHALLFRATYRQRADRIGLLYVTLCGELNCLPDARLTAPFAVSYSTEWDETYRIYVRRQQIWHADPANLPTIAEHLRAENFQELAKETIERHSWAKNLSPAVQMGHRAFMFNWQAAKELAKGPENPAALLEMMKEIIPQLRLLAWDVSVQYEKRNPLLELADALHTQACLESLLGQNDHARKSIEDAVFRSELLIRKEGNTWRPEVVAILSTRAKWQEESGQFDEAVTTRKRAIGYLEKINDANSSEEVLAKLGEQWHYLPNLLPRLGREPEALDATERAVSIFTELAKANRSSFLAKLAGALFGQAWVQLCFGLRSSGLRTFMKAFSLSFEVSESDPKRFVVLFVNGPLKVYVAAESQFGPETPEVEEDIRNCNDEALRCTAEHVVRSCGFLDEEGGQFEAAVQALLQYQDALASRCHNSPAVVDAVGRQVRALDEAVQTGRAKSEWAIVSFQLLERLKAGATRS
jgi:tetratricopeptide (TPR) repeat protein